MCHIKRIMCLIFLFLMPKTAEARSTGNYYLTLKNLAESTTLSQIRSVACDGSNFCFTARDDMDRPSLFLCSLHGEILDKVFFSNGSFLKSLAFSSSNVAVSDLTTKEVFVYSVVNARLSYRFSIKLEHKPYSVRLNSSNLFVKTFAQRTGSTELSPSVIWANLSDGTIRKTTLLDETVNMLTSSGSNDFFIAAHEKSLIVAMQTPFELIVIGDTDIPQIRRLSLSEIIFTDSKGVTSPFSGTITSVCSNSNRIYVGIKDGPQKTIFSQFEGAIVFDENGDFIFYQALLGHAKDPIITCDDSFYYAAGYYNIDRDLVTVNVQGISEWDILQAFRFLPEQEERVAGDGKGEYIYVADGGFGQMLVYSRTDHIAVEPALVFTGEGGGVYFAPHGVDKNGRRLKISGFTEYFLEDAVPNDVGTIEKIWESVGGIFIAEKLGDFRVRVEYSDIKWTARSSLCKVIERADNDGDGYSNEHEKVMGTDYNSPSSFPSETGVISFNKSVYYGHLRTSAVISVRDPGLNKNPSEQEICEVLIRSTSDPIGFPLTLMEWGKDSGLFLSSLAGENLAFITMGENSTLYRISIADGDEVSATYIDELVEGGEQNVSKTASALWFEEQVDVDVVPSGGVFTLSLLFIIPSVFFMRFRIC